MFCAMYIYSFSIYLYSSSHNKSITQTHNVPSTDGGEDTVQLPANRCLAMKAQPVVRFGIAHMHTVLRLCLAESAWCVDCGWERGSIV